ncbi:MAG: bifunctional phosphoribosylaminoimidazolecarboxamide formyltransferase/IMP cyclohydrolase, partial [Myxococcales bacterium]|nr:bifunctional phosphoribosylaminoimidazolecarboxamide formyltransferase/IMP cyclohydrolase [Myxococcales bacterium]
MSTRRALLSVSDKTDLLPLARALHAAGYGLVASGGTAAALREDGLPVTEVSDLTGFPALLGGRVKTLHPAVHAGLLAERTDAHLAELRAHGLAPIDVLVCNLYPFAETVARPDTDFAAAIEQVDIGGVTLLRAAAKNCRYVTVLCDPTDYAEAGRRLTSGENDPDWRRRLAAKAFGHTAEYDAAIADWFARQIDDAPVHPMLPPRLALTAERAQPLRYGENPHQSAALYRWTCAPLPFHTLQGKALSYNNLIDLDAAWSALDGFTEPVVAIIKHTNPCGLAIGVDAIDAFRKALASDPISAYGSIIALNRPVDGALLEVIGGLFVEVLAAPAFTDGALARLAKRKKNCRAVRIELSAPLDPQVRTIRGGLLAQTPDDRAVTPEEWQTVTQAQATEAQRADLAFAWRAARIVKSNAIVLAHDGA